MKAIHFQRIKTIIQNITSQHTESQFCSPFRIYNGWTFHQVGFYLSIYVRYYLVIMEITLSLFTNIQQIKLNNL